MENVEMNLKELQDKYNLVCSQLENALLQGGPRNDIEEQRQSVSDLSLKIYRLLSNGHPAEKPLRKNH